jgi:uncharacterized protein (TIGR03067 family)
MTRVRGVMAAAVAVLFTGVAVADDKKEAPKFDAAKMVGTWTITAGMKDGTKADVEKDKYKDAVKMTLKTPDGTFEFKYAVNDKASPVEVDLEITAPDMFKGAKATGIVKMDGDTLMLCYPAMGGEKPKNFDAKEKSGHYSFTMKKAEKKDKEPKSGAVVDK